MSDLDVKPDVDRIGYRRTLLTQFGLFVASQSRVDRATVDQDCLARDEVTIP